VFRREFDCIDENGVDTLLFDGPLLEVEITAPLELVAYLREGGFVKFPVRRGLAQIDTGAAVSAVDPSVFESLGIPFVDKEMIQTAHGVFALDRYNASVSFLQLDLSPMSLPYVLGGQILRASASGADIIMLIGRDLLRHLTFTYDGPRARFDVVLP
jgi:predicted aspartyl protease